MGSFNFVCAVSGLPIVAGDAVKYILLEQISTSRGWTCYIDDRWAPRIFPVSAEYNDYGSIENIKHSLASDLSIEVLKRDLVELDVGKNEYHDLAVKKTMTFEELLRPAWEGRLEVKPDHIERRIVEQTMIREDVWNSLLSMSFRSWYENKHLNLSDYKQHAIDYYNDLKKFADEEAKIRVALKYKTITASEMSRLFSELSNIYCLKTDLCYNNFIAGSLINSRVGSGFLVESFELIYKQEYSQNEINKFLDEVAEYAFARTILDVLKIQWKPGHTGGQDTDNKFHKQFHENILNINNVIIKKQEDDGWFDNE
jgi:hypothetical protein